MVTGLGPDGCLTFAPDAASLAWATAARKRAREVVADSDIRARNMRHDQTWFVGVDALPTGPDGSIDGVILDGPWRTKLTWPGGWHRAQLSIVYAGYPGRDPDEPDGAHRYRAKRAAAHVDGLLPIGPDRRRYPKEFHAFVLGIALSDPAAAPTVCWPGSQTIVAKAMRAAIGGRDPSQVDVTDAYHAARRQVFESCPMVPLNVPVGGAFLMHRFLLHGTAPWNSGASTGGADGRMIAFFRPEFDSPHQWLA